MSVITTQHHGIAAPSAETLGQILVDGDLEKLNPEQRLQYYAMKCEAAGLDPRSQPFLFVRLQGKLVLYATKSATQQLCGRNKISTEILGSNTEGGMIEYRVRAKRPDGQFADEIGVVPEARGNEGANARMKALTKAKRRAVLALCGLEVMDESELPDGAQAVQADLGNATAKAVPPYMDADKASRLRAICKANNIPPEVVKVQIMSATGGRFVEKGPQNIPLYSQAEYETLVASLKSWKTPAEGQGAVPAEASATEVMDREG